MTARWILIAAAFLSLVTPAFAHRLDEYLEATTIEIVKGHATLELRLTPGVDVAAKVLAAIDANGDGVLSDAEQGAYAEQVRRDLSLAVDGAPGPLRLVSFSFPTIHELTAGVGDIELRFEGTLPTDGSNHNLTFENHHLSAIAVYLVNTLLPRDPGIRILKQDRSYDQSAYRLDVALGAPSSSAQSDAAGPGPQRQWERSDEMSIVGTYFWHGIHHILTGYDHLLFIAALVLGATTLWDLVKVVTAFTVAHSITLTLAAMNLVHLPDGLVEPLISASIVFVALQNIVWPEQSRGGTRLAVAFFFGLFHGLGFAGGLLEIMHQMPMETVRLAIAGFSLGGEAGNQMVLAPLFGVLKVGRRSGHECSMRARIPRIYERIGSAGVSVAGIYYLCLALAAQG